MNLEMHPLTIYICLACYRIYLFAFGFGGSLKRYQSICAVMRLNWGRKKDREV